MQPYYLVDPKQKAADITSGLMIGLIDHDNFDFLTDCFGNADEFNDSISETMTLIETKTNENIAKSIQKLADTVKEMPDQLSDCAKSHEDADALKAWADSLPESGEFEQKILKNLKSNRAQVKLDIAHASVQNMRYEHFELGHRLGSLAVFLT